MAEDLTELVTIQHPHGEIREVPRGALAHFVNNEQNWVVLDKRGHVSTSATTAAKKES